MQHNLAAGATKYELLAFKYFAVPRVRLLQVQHIVHSNAIAMEALKLQRHIVQLMRRATGHLPPGILGLRASGFLIVGSTVGMSCAYFGPAL